MYTDSEFGMSHGTVSTASGQSHPRASGFVPLSRRNLVTDK